MNLKNLSDHELHTRTVNRKNHIRSETINQLWHLRENESRLLYAKMGYKDLKEYCVKELKLSEGSAWRRISAMRLLKEIPEIETKIQSGQLNLTQITQAKAHFSECKTPKSEKVQMLGLLENQTTRATERILAENKPAESPHLPEVREKLLKGHKIEATLIIDQELQNELEEIQIMLGKKMSKLELFKMLAKEKLALLKKELYRDRKSKFSQRKAQPAAIEQNSTTLKKQSRYMSAQVIKELALRDQHQCQYRDPLTGRKCSARLHLQIEHIGPFAKGGVSRLENLQMLCANHNRLRAVQHFGADKMRPYLSQLL